MFLFSRWLNGGNGMVLGSDNSYYTHHKEDIMHLDVFMALFMVCTIEIVVLKIMLFDETVLQEDQTTVNTAQGPVPENELF